MRRFLSARFVLWLGTAVAGTATVALLALFGLSLALAILILVTIALVVWIIFLTRQLRQAKAAKEIERTISRQADLDIERSVPGKVAEAQSMKEDLLRAIESLKSSKVAGRRGETALSVLPWYMLIGPPGAGKSSLIRRSGLHFPLVDAEDRPRSVRGVGGTKSFEWWLSQEAVLLDMRGRTLTTAAFEDTDDWLSFLQVLRRQRKRKPLSGVIVAVPLDQIADQPEAQVTALARGVRERVQELVHHLHTVFPVYVVFTKCDQVAGFTEFFADLEPGGRHQPWGATLSMERSRSDPAEVLFDEELSILESALSDRRMLRFAGVPDPVQRARVFSFPLQLEAVRVNARRFLKVLFEPDPVEETPLFRGFYFTSAVQEGAPTDRVFTPALRSLGVAAPAPPPPPASSNGSFFVQDLFRRIIFPDANLATPSTRAEALRRRSRRILFLAGVALYLGILIFLSILGGLNGRLVDRTRRASVDVAERVQDQATLIENLASLERLRVQVATVDSLSRRKPPWLGLYSGDPLREPSLTLYTEKTIDALIAPAVKLMEARLTELTDAGAGSFLEYYELFYAWRLLTSPSHVTPEDVPLLSKKIGEVLESRVATTASVEERRRFPRLVTNQVAFLAAHADWLAKLAPGRYPTSNEPLVQRGADRIVRTWDSSQFYRLLLNEAAAHAANIPLKKLVESPGFLTTSRSAWGVFTRAGWEQEVRPRVESYRRQMERNWVVMEAFHQRPPDLAHDLLAHYARGYSRHWARFLQYVEIRPVSSWEDAIELLKQAASGSSPCLKLIQAVAKETDLGADPSSELGAVQRDFAMAGEFFDASKEPGLAKRIKSSLGGLIGRGGQDARDPTQPASATYRSLLQNVVERVSKVAQPGEPASEIAKLAAYGDEASNPIKAVLTWTRELQDDYQSSLGSAAVARILRLPIDGVMEPTCGAIKEDLGSKWRMLVVQPFEKTLGGKYPFSEGGPPASLPDFTEFFRPEGTLWKFYADQLSPYLTEDGTPRNEQGGRCFSPEFRASLRRGYEIREAFFTSNSQEASVRFSVRTSVPQQEGSLVAVREISLDVGGQPTPYAMGVRQYREVVWPGPDPSLGAALRIQTAPGSPAAEPRVAQGVWGLFRLLEQGRVASPDGGNPQVVWDVPAGPSKISVTYEIQPASVRHPFQPGFFSFHPAAGP